MTGEDPLSGHLFVFRNRRGDKLKVLLWDRDGYVMIYKRLEEGVFKLPKARPDQASMNLKPSELAMLMDGIDLSGVKRGKRYRRHRKGDPFVYLRDVLATIAATPVSQLDQFLPDRWRKQQLKEIAER